MKSIFHKELKPLSDFEKASLMNVEDDYLGLYIPSAIDKNSVSSKWHVYYLQAGKTNITIMDDFPARHFAGSLLLEHPYELKGIFNRKKLHSEDYAIIEPVDIRNYITMSLPDGTIGQSTMFSNGYHWDGMIAIGHVGAKSVPEDVPLYVLNSDNTETLVENREEIQDGFIYGVQKPDWYHHLYRSDDEEIEEEN